MRLPMLALATLLIGACATGSSTTQRPALVKPAIGPDGTFWDAVTVAERRDNEAFLYLLSPQMVFRSLFPEADLKQITTQEQFDNQRTEIETALEQHNDVVQQLAARYMVELDKLVRDKFVEVSRPDYEIKYNDGYDRAEGPNLARVKVKVYPKGNLAADIKPESIELTFIQDGRRWLIHAISNDKLKGAFVR